MNTRRRSLNVRTWSLAHWRTCLEIILCYGARNFISELTKARHSILSLTFSGLSTLPHSLSLKSTWFTNIPTSKSRSFKLSCYPPTDVYEFIISHIYYRIILFTPFSVPSKYICIYVCLYMFRLVNNHLQKAINNISRTLLLHKT
jgi:hypothetical protein